MPFNFSTLALPGTLFLGGATSWLHPLLLVPEPLFLRWWVQQDLHPLSLGPGPEFLPCTVHCGRRLDPRVACQVFELAVPQLPLHVLLVTLVKCKL